MFYFLLRALPHWLFFTPKSDVLPPPRLAYQGPYVGAIFGSNLICILSHILFAPPAAGEASRGYLHGGMIIDFVGQASPVSRWRLVGLDTLCLVLQVVMMCLTLEKQSLQGRRRAKSPGRMDRSDANASEEVAGRRSQDLDAEERGMFGSENAGGIAMQDLSSSSPISSGPATRGRTGGDEDRERDELLAHELQEEERDDHPLDIFYSGDYTLMKLHLLDTIRSQWRTSSISASSANAAAVRTADMQTAAGDLVGRRVAFTWSGRTGGGDRVT